MIGSVPGHDPDSAYNFKLTVFFLKRINKEKLRGLLPLPNPGCDVTGRTHQTGILAIIWHKLYKMSGLVNWPLGGQSIAISSFENCQAVSLKGDHQAVFLDHISLAQANARSSVVNNTVSIIRIIEEY